MSVGSGTPHPEHMKKDHRLTAIFLIVLVDVLGLTIILPLLPFYSEHFGASPTTVGLLISVYAGCQLFSGPILGIWSDRFGRKPVLLISQVGTCIGFLVMAFAPSLKWLFVARIIDGVTAGNLSTAQAYITDVAQPKERAKALGKIGIAFGIGFFVGPALTAFLYRYGYRAPILAAASLSFLSIFATLVLLPSSPLRAKAIKLQHASVLSDAARYLRDRRLRRPLAQIFLFYFSFSAYMAGFALFAERRFRLGGLPLTPRQVGYAFAYFGLVGIVTQLFCIGKLVGKLGERRVAVLGFICSFIGYGMLCFVHTAAGIAISGALSSFGGGVLRPVLLSGIAGNVPSEERGVILGFTQTIQALAQIAAPLLSTALLAGTPLFAWALLPAIVSGLGLYAVISMTQE